MTELSKNIITFGCRLNNLESELIDQQLKKHSIDKNTFIELFSGVTPIIYDSEIVVRCDKIVSYFFSPSRLGIQLP